ncbi:MAG TPA: chondroitinase-B domain-containing protein [Vicinamibacteria bacterium]|nr:chondroitinase-B domain-containing protein [Vicinamibacteria bacterium]
MGSRVRMAALAVLALLFAVIPWRLHAAVVPVSSPAELIAAINAASPGDTITLSAGTYSISQNLLCDTPGTEADPIVVRAATLGQALIEFDAVEGFKVSAPHWRFENLEIEGVCSTHDACEHAFHVFGAADFTHIRENRIREYNAMIKVNGVDPGGGMQFPDDVVIEFNHLYNTTVRNTANPVTPIDVVGGRRYVVRGNTIHDFGKGLGNTISYAAFLKGNSKDGRFERNLVICELNHTDGIRLGLSFGGGGTAPDSVCEESTCTPEHSNGIMRNNLIVECPDDVGIYLNEATNTRIYNNTLYRTTGIDVRFLASSADVSNNLLSGAIRNRDGGSSNQTANLVNVTDPQFAAWFDNPGAADFDLVDGTTFVDQGTFLSDVYDDYCRNLRDDGFTDIGALEYDGDGPCDSSMAGGVGVAGDTLKRLLVTKTGAGAGTVESQPMGIDCGADCVEDFVDGSVVSLSLVPDGGSELASVGGDTDCSDSILRMTSDRSCIVDFDLCAIPLVTIMNETLANEMREACDEMFVGPMVTISGEVTLRAGSLVTLGDAFVVESGASLTIAIGPP